MVRNAVDRGREDNPVMRRKHLAHSWILAKLAR